ncbi:MAG TPA: restriction endonuclease subunit S, partial [Acidimicrobiia bacterium]|nr:restriction endonuclease subunit S [Acidimicrobiia bacterium]
PGVVIGRKGSLGGVYYSESDFWPHDTTLWVKDFKGNDPLFTYYFLKTLGLERFDVGAANPTLNRNHLHLLPISAPSVATQHKIAVVLAAYDELIKSNLRRIEILEEMAQAVYREWFVNFRIPGYEDVALVDSPLGPIPRGWELGTLEAIVENVRASTKAGPHLDELPYVPIDCIRARSFTLRESKRGAEAKSSLILFKESDILFGAMRPYFHKVAIAPGEGVTRTTCFVLRPRMRTWRSFALLTMFRDETIAYATNHSRGTTIPYASWDGSLAAMTICTPTDGLLERFDTEVTPMLELARNLARQNANLQATRDLLLPRLVSGEIDVLGLDIDTEWLAS